MFFILVAGCADDRPAANLVFKGLYEKPQGFVFEFTSDRNFDALYVDNKYRNVVRKSLICSLTSDENFDLEHRLQYVFEGDVELVDQPKKNTMGAYRYLSLGDFYERTSGSSADLLRGESLRRLLEKRKFVHCRVIMTIYLSSPYFSNVMLVPTGPLMMATLR